jgi:hypothetical protein
VPASKEGQGRKVEIARGSQAENTPLLFIAVFRSGTVGFGRQLVPDLFEHPPLGLTDQCSTTTESSLSKAHINVLDMIDDMTAVFLFRIGQSGLCDRKIAIKPVGAIGDDVPERRWERVSWNARAGKDLEDIQSIWINDLQFQLVHLSSQGKQIMVPDSDHMIPLERPDAIVSAVYEVCAKVNSK